MTPRTHNTSSLLKALAISSVAVAACGAASTPVISAHITASNPKPPVAIRSEEQLIRRPDIIYKAPRQF